MLFKDYLKLHGVGDEYLSPDGVLARINLGHGMFEPYQPKLRASLTKVPLFEVIQPGVFVKFKNNFKMQRYSETSGMGFVVKRLFFPMVKLVDFIFRTNVAELPPFYGYIEGNTASKDNSQFPFGTFLKVRTVRDVYSQYEEPDGTIWQVSHIPLAEVRWIEILSRTNEQTSATSYRVASSPNPMSDVIGNLRALIEDPGLRKKHFAHSEDHWSKFCVAMDTLEDSDLAISDFLESDLGSSEGERYLRLYGILQAVFLQQDAIKALWEIVMEDKFPKMSDDSPWKLIRDIRNLSVGHPIEVKRDGIVKRTFVTRIDLEVGVLSLITDVSTGNSEHQAINLNDVVASYLTDSSKHLTKIADTIPIKWPNLEALMVLPQLGRQVL